MNRLLCTLSLVATVSLSACGGGGNESGPPDSIYLSVTTVTVVGDGTNCFPSLGPEVHVFGGTPPYKLSNSLPQGIALNKSVVQNSGDSFVITFRGPCMQTMPVTVEDQMGLIAQVLLTNSK